MFLSAHNAGRADEYPSTFQLPCGHGSSFPTIISDILKRRGGMTDAQIIINQPFEFSQFPEMAHATESTAPEDCVGPDYRPKTEKPTATVSTQILYDNVHILPQTPQLIALLT